MSDWPDLAGRLEDGGHVLPVRVYYEDTDFTGIVYHGAYVRFFERVTERVRDNADVMAQVENNTMDQAMRGDLPGAVTDAIVDSLAEDQERSERLLSDGEVMGRFVRLVFQVLRESGVERPYPAGRLDV